MSQPNFYADGDTILYRVAGFLLGPPAVSKPSTQPVRSTLCFFFPQHVFVKRASFILFQRVHYCIRCKPIQRNAAIKIHKNADGGLL